MQYSKTALFDFLAFVLGAYGERLFACLHYVIVTSSTEAFAFVMLLATYILLVVLGTIWVHWTKS